MKLSSNWYYNWRCLWPGIRKLTKFGISPQYLKKEVSNWVDFFDTDQHSNLQQIDTLMVKHFQVSQNSKFAVFLQYLKKEVSNEVDFFACRYTSKFSTSWFQHCYKVKQSLLMRMIKHSKSTQCNIFAISFQQYQKKVVNGVHLFHADQYQRFYKLALSFLMEVAIYIKSSQNRNLVILLQDIFLKKYY